MVEKHTRRQALLLGLGGLAAIPLGYIIGVSLGGYEKSQKYKQLSPRDVAVVGALCEALIFSSRQPLGLDLSIESCIQGVDEFIANMPVYARKRYNLLFWAVEYLFPLRQLKFGRFSRLSVEARRQILESFERAKQFQLRALAKGIRVTIYIGLYDQEIVGQRVGVPQKCLSK